MLLENHTIVLRFFENLVPAKFRKGKQSSKIKENKGFSTIITEGKMQTNL